MKTRGWLITVIGLLLMFGAVLGMRIYQRWTLVNRAEALYAAGSYDAAREIYLTLEDKESAARCEEMVRLGRYEEAAALLDAGAYEEAEAIFRGLGDYRDSAAQTRRSVFLNAGRLCDIGQPERARQLYLSLGDYPGCKEALDGITPKLYDRALTLASNGSYADACAIWRDLADFRDSAQLLKRGEKALTQWADAYRMKLNDPKRRLDIGYYPESYQTDDAYILFPEEPNADTRFFLYIPGGWNEEINADFLCCYLNNPAPNTLAVLLRRNALPDMEACCENGLRILDEAAADCGLFMRSVVVAGSSLGAYPALQFPRIAYGQGVKVSCALTLDAGNRWNQSDLVPTFAECRALAQTGTQLYLFQPTWVDDEYEPIKMLVNAGNWVMLAGCLRDDHEQITYDVLNLGVIDWALGDRSGPCPGEIYSFRRLTLAS